jgi:hypothetical protein
MSDSELAVVSIDSFATPILITRADPSTRKKFFEFFTVPIRNPNTRAAYYRAIQQFLGWLLSRKLFENVNSLFANDSDGYKTTSAPSAFRFSCGRNAAGQDHSAWRSPAP